jgi:hypothetical protein
MFVIVLEVSLQLSLVQRLLLGLGMTAAPNIPCLACHSLERIHTPELHI